MKTSPAELDLVVVRRRAVARDVDAFTLALSDGGALPAWLPGAHVDLLLPDGALGGAVQRQYSLCGDPADAVAWTIAVLREDSGRGGSAWIHANLAPGAAVRARGPWNHFALVEATGYRLVAGGIGITPLLSMISAAHAAGVPWTLDYAGRSRATMAFVGEIESYGGAVHVHAADEGGRLDIGALAPAKGELVFACGPKRMLEALDLVASAWAPGTLHVERFEAREVGEPMLHETFEVEFALTGVTLQVDPTTSILEAAEAAGAFVLSSCREGTCGTCETVVLKGEVDHRDSILTDAERTQNDRMMVCVSRAACPRLVLEL